MSARAPSSRLRHFHLPHWESLLTHCGLYKYLINMVSTIIYIHAPLNGSIRPQRLRPRPGRRLHNLRGQSRGFVLLEKGYRRRGKLCSTSHLLVELAYKHGSQEEHTRCSRVGSPNPEELQGKRRDRPKRYVISL